MITIETPVTYRIEFEIIGAFRLHDTVYYSLSRAVRSFIYYRDKYKLVKVVRIYAYRGDTQLRDITQDVLNLIQ